MSQLIIRSTFMTALAAYAAAHSPVLQIAREDVVFTKPTDNTPFLEAILIPANTINPTTNATRKRFLGTFQINIWVKQNLGTGIAETIISELSALFPVVPKTYLPVSIETPLSAHQSINDLSGFRIVPCTLTYRMET